MANHGGFFTMASDGWIAEYTAEGELLFWFHTADITSQRLGVLRMPTSIVQDARGNLYVSDAASGLIHLFAPTEFTRWVHLAITYFQEGRYVESMSYWREVLRMHSAFSLAHLAIGHALFLQGDYAQARAHFYQAGYIGGYSDSFWEIRSDWLYVNAGGLVLGFVGLFVLAKGYKKARKTDAPVKNRPLLDELLHMKKVLRHPIDAFYDIRFQRKATPRAAAILYAALFIVFFLTLLSTGFIFTPGRFWDIQEIMAFFTGVIALFVGVNYMVATVNEGEGSFRDIFVGTAYAASPFILFALPVTLITHVLTLNEEFVYQFLMIAIVLWSLALVFIMLKEMHDYNIRDTIKNILLTVFAGGVAVLVAFVMYLLLNQVYLFVSNLLAEVGTRV
jgi:hypothetical protein